MRTLHGKAWIDEILKLYAHIKILPLEELRRLPECGDYDGGIYFLWLKNKLQYIGKSKQISYRLVLHESANIYGHSRARVPKQIPFDRHTCIVLDKSRICSDWLDEELKERERAYIAYYTPPFNYIGTNPGT